VRNTCVRVSFHGVDNIRPFCRRLLVLFVVSRGRLNWLQSSVFQQTLNISYRVACILALKFTAVNTTTLLVPPNPRLRRLIGHDLRENVTRVTLHLCVLL